MEMVEKDESQWSTGDGERRGSDEWESVDAYAVGTAKNGEKTEEEWDGIVGFFHPFWWVKLDLLLEMWC